MIKDKQLNDLAKAVGQWNVPDQHEGERAYSNAILFRAAFKIVQQSKKVKVYQDEMKKKMKELGR